MYYLWFVSYERSRQTKAVKTSRGAPGEKEDFTGEKTQLPINFQLTVAGGLS